MRRAHLLAATALLALAAAPSALAGSLYGFGDSLSDNGNLYKLISVPPPPYYEGHFSNGPIWDEYLPGLTGLNFTASQDYAVGGAFTGDLVVNGRDRGTNLISPDLPGVTTEIAEFAHAGGHFSNSDVVTLWAGANNYFFYAAQVKSRAEADALVASGVATTIAQLTADTNSLISLGARTMIVPNLPDLGSTPDYNTTATRTELADAFTSLHDEDLPIAMQGVHNQTGANIIVLNTQLLLEKAIADPAAYGFDNVTQACIDVPACVDGGIATQNTYLFWDGVHPTTHAQYLVAEYAADSLKGFESLSVPGRLGTTDALDFASLLGSRMETLRAAGTGFTYNIPAGVYGAPADPSTDPAQKLSVYITGGGSFGGRNDTATTLGFTDNSSAVAAGADYAFSGNFRGGLAVGLTNGHADVNQGGSVKDNAANVGVYGLAVQGPLYAEISGAYGDHWYDSKSPEVFGGDLRGKTGGHSYSANLAAGYVFPLNPAFSLTPQAGLSYTNNALQGYTETGDAMLTQAVENQGYQQLLGNADVEAATFHLFGNTRVAAYATAGLQARLSGDNSQFDSSFTDEPVVSLTTTYPAEPVAWALFGAGLSAGITPHLFASAALQATAFKSNGNDLMISGAANWTF